MPPSGYSAVQSDLVSSFLESCAKALIKDAALQDQPLHEALLREIRDIENYCRAHDLSEFQNAILSATAVFYKKIAAEKPRTETDYYRAVGKSVSTVSEEMKSITI